MKRLALAIALPLALAAGCTTMHRPPHESAAAFARNADGPARGIYNVADFGAVGDGTTDDTAAFQAALDAAGAGGGGVVQVPAGGFMIAGHLVVPEHVALEGVWRAPPRTAAVLGTTLLAVEGQGDPDGVPFLTLRTNATIKGLVIHYPGQIDADPPHAYPWTVRGIGDNCSIIDVLMTNPYQAVDFGTFPAGRHLISRLYAQALYRGIFVDKCFDVGRIENVHFWPFWRISPALQSFSEREAIAFVFGRTDWQYVSNCFTIFYNTGFLFTSFDDGPGNVIVTGSGADLGPTAVRVERVQEHAGVTFANCQIMAGVEVLPSNRGPVKFTSSGFWPVDATREQVIVDGAGTVALTGCHFAGWGLADPDAPCIRIRGGRALIVGCDFMDPQKTQIVVEEGAEGIAMTGCRLRGGLRVVTPAAGPEIQIGFNLVEPPAPPASEDAPSRESTPGIDGS